MRVRNIEISKIDRALNAVYHGRMTRQQAELIALQQGLVLQSEPRAADYDPLKATMWSLSMTITWIVWRDAGNVTKVWTDYRSKHVQWRKDETRSLVIDYDFDSDSKPTHETGWTLASLMPVHPSELESFWRSQSHTSDPLEERFEDARRELWGKLSNSELVGTAVDLDTARPCDVPAREWTYLRSAGNTDGLDLLKFDGGVDGYRDLRLRRDDVCRLWPSGSTHESNQEGHLLTVVKNTKARSHPKRVLAIKAIQALYSDGPPDKSEVPDAVLLDEVSAKLKEMKFRYPISDDTILRAAGRKK